MFKPLRQILLATDLTENCSAAFDFAASLATRYQATLVLLHVIEKMPGYLEGRLRALVGAAQWQAMMDKHAETARTVLIGKQSSTALIQAALEHFCAEAGIDDNACGYHSREIVIADGEVVDEVIRQSRKFACDLIVLGTHKGFIASNTIGANIKNIMRQSRIPVLVVPPAQAQASVEK